MAIGRAIENMRKHSAHLSISLITFLLGIATTLPFKQPADAPGLTEKSVAILERLSASEIKVSFSCENRVLQDIWNDYVSSRDFSDYLAIVNVQTLDCSECFTTEAVDLNRDGKAEVAVKGKGLLLCSPTGNCPFWVYRESPDGYELILTASKDVQTYKFKKTSTNGYSDLETFMHGSAYDSDISVYKFDGRHYRLEECGNRSYSFIDKSGRLRVRKYPLITKEPCEELTTD